MVNRNDLDLIFDRASFAELSEGFADSIVTGYGTVEGRLCYVFLQDGEKGGVFSKDAGKKITNIYRLAMKSKAPVIGVLDSSGFLIDDGVEALNAFSEVYEAVSRAKDEILQIMISGGKTLGQMASLAGMADFYYKDLGMEEALLRTKEIILTLPHSKGLYPEQLPAEDDLNRLNVGIEELKDNGREVLREISDKGFLLEFEDGESPELTAGIIKMNGLPVAALANNKVEGHDRMGFKALLKARLLIRVANKFNMALIIVSNTPGLRTDEDPKLMLLAAGELADMLVNTHVPKINLITGKVVGGAFSIFNGKGTGSDLTFMWKGSEVDIINPRQAAEILYPDAGPGQIEEKTQEYIETHSKAETLVSLGIADKVIEPSETRKYLAGALETYANVL